MNKIRTYIIWHRILQYSDKKASLNIDGQLSSPLNMPPISDDEFNKGKKYTGLRKEILNFLCENKRKAYTIVDLIEYLRPSISFSEINEANLKQLVGLTTVSVVERHFFQSALDDLIEDDLVKARLVGHDIYYKCK